MPEHAHFLLVGLNERAVQLPALKWIRREWNLMLRALILKDQAYDHVLREADHKCDAFADVVGYILRNQARKELVTDWQEWPYSGAISPGYQKLDPRKVLFGRAFGMPILFRAMPELRCKQWLRPAFYGLRSL